MTRRSIVLPLTLGITLMVVAAALAVGWQILVVRDLQPVTLGLTGLHWTLIILGSVFFVLLIVGLLLLCLWLVREMRLNQRQQAFLDAVTHEMKTPLASLRLYCETLARHDPGAERRRVFLGRMEADVERLERTVQQILAAARAEGARPVRPRAVALDEVLTHCADEIRARHQLPREALQLAPAAGRRVWGDPHELTMVFRNLLENAVKYSDAPVEVEVRVRGREDERIDVEIADRGIGIERRELRKIFQRFYRVGRDVQRQAAGLGLGLFIVRNLVRRQGGRVEARSEGSGQGSRFLVTLRAAGDPAQVDTTASAPTQAGVGSV